MLSFSRLLVASVLVVLLTCNVNAGGLRKNVVSEETAIDESFVLNLHGPWQFYFHP